MGENIVKLLSECIKKEKEKIYKIQILVIQPRHEFYQYITLITCKLIHELTY